MKYTETSIQIVNLHFFRVFKDPNKNVSPKLTNKNFYTTLSRFTYSNVLFRMINCIFNVGISSLLNNFNNIFNKQKLKKK